MSKRPINAEVSPRYKNEPVERMIRRFLKKVKKNRIIEEYRERQYYKKPSEKRKRESLKREKVLEKLRIERENAH